MSSELIKKFQQYKKEVEKAQNEESRLRGRLESIQSSAEEEFGTSKVSELKKILQQKQKRKEELEEQLQEKLNELGKYLDDEDSE